MNRIGRREFLRKAGMGGLATPYLILSATGAARQPATNPFSFRVLRLPRRAFRYSIASGDPTPSGVVLWTRVNKSVWRVDRDLGFQVALDPGFRRLVLQGVVAGSQIGPETDYTVHVDLDGQLEPDRFYYYRFIYDETRSRPGRCRTLPAPGTPKESLTLALVTCQDFTNGYYGAFSHVALDPRVDYVLHLGDFIYETTGDTEFQDNPFPDRGIHLPSGKSRAFGLGDYRALYRRYGTDRWFRMAMEFHTWIVIWDDHETSNDCYWDYDRDTLGAPDHPFQTDPAFGNDPARLRQLKLDAQRAWAEYVPTRLRFNPAVGHPFDALQIYQRIQFGDLVDLYLTDQRTYRSPHPCGEKSIGGRIAAVDCPQRHAPDQTMLGAPQRDWLVEQVTQSRALWKAWANEVFLGELTLGQSGPKQIVFTRSFCEWAAFTVDKSVNHFLAPAQEIQRLRVTLNSRRMEAGPTGGGS